MEHLDKTIKQCDVIESCRIFYPTARHVFSTVHGIFIKIGYNVKPHKSSSTGEWINKLCHSHVMRVPAIKIGKYRKQKS